MKELPNRRTLWIATLYFIICCSGFFLFYPGNQFEKTFHPLMRETISKSSFWSKSIIYCREIEMLATLLDLSITSKMCVTVKGPLNIIKLYRKYLLIYVSAIHYNVTYGFTLVSICLCYGRIKMNKLVHVTLAWLEMTVSAWFDSSCSWHSCRKCTEMTRTSTWSPGLVWPLY